MFLKNELTRAHLTLVGNDGLYELASGESFIIRDPQEKDEDISLAKSLLVKARGVIDGVTSAGEFKLFNSSRRVIETMRPKNGLKIFGRRDAELWANRIVDGDYWPEKVFPYWVFSSIAADLEMNRGLGPISKISNKLKVSQPDFVTVRPGVDELRYIGLREDDVGEFCRETPPTLIGKAVPIFGWYDDYADCIHPQYTILRKGSGLSGGDLVFPGGHTSNLLDFTSWREFKEESVGFDLGDSWWFVEEDDVIESRHPLLIDQVLLTDSGDLRRYLIDVYSFQINFGGIANDRFDMESEEFKQHVNPLSWDEGDFWNFFDIGSGFDKLVRVDIWEMMSLIDRLALRSIKNSVW